MPWPPWGNDDDDRNDKRILRRLDHIGGRLLNVELMQVDLEVKLDRLLDLLRPQDPASVSIIPLEGASMDIQIAPGETQTFSYTEQDGSGNPITPLVGTPAWNVPDANVATDSDNGDNTVTLTGVNGGSTALEVTVTYPSGNSGSDSASVTCTVPVADPASVSIVAA